MTRILTRKFAPSVVKMRKYSIKELISAAPVDRSINYIQSRLLSRIGYCLVSLVTYICLQLAQADSHRLPTAASLVRQQVR
jgi:hypothetical protein